MGILTHEEYDAPALERFTVFLKFLERPRDSGKITIFHVKSQKKLQMFRIHIANQMVVGKALVRSADHFLSQIYTRQLGTRFY